MARGDAAPTAVGGDGAEQRVRRSAMAILLGSAGEGFIGFLFAPILVRLPGIGGAAGYGDFATIIGIFALGQVLVNLGLFNAVRKSVAEVEGEHQRALASGGLLLAAFTGGAATVAGLFLLGAPDLPADLERLRLPLAVMCFTLLFWNLFQVARSILFGLHAEASVEPLRVVQQIVYVSFAILLVSFGYGIAGVFLGLLIGTGTAAVAALARVEGRLDVGWRLGRRGLAQGREMVVYGWYTTLGVVMVQLLYQADILLVSVMLGNFEAGVYKSANVLAEMLWIVPGALQISLLHNVSSLWAKRRKAEIGAVVDKALTVGLLVVILGTVGIVALAGPLVVIYFGPEFASAVLPVQLLTIGAAGFGVARIISPVVEGTGLLRQNVLAGTGLTVANLVLSVLLIPVAGIVGAALVTGATYFAKIGQTYILARRTGIHIGATVPWARIGGFGISVGLAGVLARAMGPVWGWSSFETLALGGGLILLAALAAGAALRLFSPGSLLATVRGMIRPQRT